MKKIKLIIFLFAIIFIGGEKVTVKAESFVSGEKIPNAYRNKEKNGELISSVQQNVIRNASTNEIVYCIEPSVGLIEPYEYKVQNKYQDYSTNMNITAQDYNRITALAYYGYGYLGHNDLKWYAITQMLIWKTVDKTTDFYWVDKPYGKKISPYDIEIAELEKLLSDDNLLPKFDINEVYSIKKEYTLIDDNNILFKFKIKESDILNISKIEDNKLIVNSEYEGTKKIKLENIHNQYKSPVTVYLDSLSQNLIQRGNLINQTVELELRFESGTLDIRKIDRTTNSILPSGTASLIGAVYHLYDENNNFINEMIIDADNKSVTTNLAFGKYILKEVQSGSGYYLNEDIYEFEINENNKNINVDVINEVINSKIILKKYYGNDSKWRPEANIAFDIYDSKGVLYANVETNKEGIIEIVLPYDTYTFTQINTSDNYQKVSDFKITVDENSNKEILLELYDLEIEIPNTYIKIKRNGIYLFSIIANISLCTKVFYEYR